MKHQKINCLKYSSFIFIFTKTLKTCQNNQKFQRFLTCFNTMVSGKRL